MNKFIFLFFISIITIPIFHGCAPINATITSEPEYADVYYDGEYVGKTPQPVSFALDNVLFSYNERVISPRKIEVKKKGFLPKTKTFDRIYRKAPVPHNKTHFILEKKSDFKLTYKDIKQNYTKKINTLKASTSNSLWRSPRNTRLLLIGIQNYKDKSIPEVSNAVTDALTFKSFAESANVPNNNITSLTNTQATRSDIMDAIQKLKMATTENNETAILYFSGHGAPIVKDGKITDAVIVPYDAKESSLEYTGIKISTIENILKEVRGNWIVILDACFTGKEGRSLLAKNVKGLHIVPDKIIKTVPKKQLWWITATSGDNFANDFPKQNQGLFTYYFIKALNGEKGVDKNGDGLITLQEAFTWTKSEVQDVSAKSLGRKQVPELIGKEDIILTMPK